MNISLLGQSGCRVESDGHVLYMDPYLSDSVEQKFGPEFKRMVSIPFAPNTVVDADTILITHDHLDHCDPESLIPISKSSPNCNFFAPRGVACLLIDWGVDEERVNEVKTGIPFIAGTLHIEAIPASHPEEQLDEEGNSACVSYLLQDIKNDTRMLLAGDSSLTDSYLARLQQFGDIDICILPVNERNYERESLGIIGNMSVRDAFYLADQVNAKTVIPVHWDMFYKNLVYKEEILTIYKYSDASFELCFEPEGCWNSEESQYCNSYSK